MATGMPLPNALGVGGEKYVSSQLGLTHNTNLNIPVPGAGYSVRPDFIDGGDLIEAKNTRRTPGFTKQLEGMFKIIQGSNQQLVVVTRASTAERAARSGRAKLLQNAVSKGGLSILGCLPG